MPPDLLVIGHVVQDILTGDKAGPWRLGGAVAYAGLLGRNLGLSTAVLTAASPEIDVFRLLQGVDVRVLPGDRTTRIRNVYQRNRRRQFIPERAAPITPADVPREWAGTRIVLLGPVAGELGPGIASCFPGALMGAGAQGWLRRIDERDFAVHPLHPDEWDAEPLSSYARALFVSDEDIPSDAAAEALARWCSMFEIVAFTRGYNGADLCHQGKWRHIAAFPATAVDPTGAGDIFAAAFLIRLAETTDVWEATRFAACAASFIVEAEGIAAVPDRTQIDSRLAAHPDIIATP